MYCVLIVISRKGLGKKPLTKARCHESNTQYHFTIVTLPYIYCCLCKVQWIFDTIDIILGQPIHFVGIYYSLLSIIVGEASHVHFLSTSNKRSLIKYLYALNDVPRLCMAEPLQLVGSLVADSDLCRKIKAT